MCSVVSARSAERTCAVRIDATVRQLQSMSKASILAAKRGGKAAEVASCAERKLRTGLCFLARKREDGSVVASPMDAAEWQDKFAGDFAHGAVLGSVGPRWPEIQISHAMAASASLEVTSATEWSCKAANALKAKP